MPGRARRAWSSPPHSPTIISVVGAGLNTPTAYAATNERLLAEVAKTGRDVGSYPLMMVIADETDDAAFAKWRCYVEGADTEALSYLGIQANG